MKWSKVPFCDNMVEVTETGLVRHVLSKKQIKPYVRKDSGYTYFRYKNKTMYVHRCVMSAFDFIVGCENLEVNHKDFNPSNNNFENLEWGTHDYNMKYGIKFGRYKHSADVARSIGLKKAKEGKLEFHTNITLDQHLNRYKKRSLNYKVNGNHPNKGRTGLRGTNCKLTIELINEIRTRKSNGEYAIRIAESLGLSRQTIDNVLHNKKNYT